nr:arsenate reductase ArsC [Gilliamella apicola]
MPWPRLFFNNLAPTGWSAVSAGSQPVGYIHPNAITILQQHYIGTAGLLSKSWNDLDSMPDIVITVCASAAGETCPIYLGKAIRSHWGLTDPAKATGTEQEIAAVFEQTFNQFKQAITFFLQQPLDELFNDKLQKLFNEVGQHFFNEIFQ